MAVGGEVGLGLAPHSGWAVLVGVIEAGRGITVAVRERIEMADARAPESRQPYHAVQGLTLEDAAERLSAWAAVAERRAASALEDVRARLTRDGRGPVGVAILESAGRKGRSLAETLASHALVHTADGEHFRAALQGAAARCGLRAVRVPGRELPSRTAAATGRTIQELEAAVKAGGRQVGPPWGADQKKAALLGWLLLRLPPA